MSSPIEELRRRVELANYYYDNALNYYRKGDRSKASEFIWGVITAITYALGLLHGEILGDHGKLTNFLKGVAEGRRDYVMREEIAAAESLHANFYHNFMDELQFEVYWRKAESLSRRLMELLREEASKRGIVL